MCITHTRMKGSSSWHESIARLGLVLPVDEAHKLAHHVAVKVWRAEGVVLAGPSLQ